MKVRLTTGLSGPAGSWQPGDTFECSAEEAARLIEAGYADSIAAKAEKAVKAAAPVKREG